MAVSDQVSRVEAALMLDALMLEKRSLAEGGLWVEMFSTGLSRKNC